MGFNKIVNIYVNRLMSTKIEHFMIKFILPDSL